MNEQLVRTPPIHDRSWIDPAGQQHLAAALHRFVSRHPWADCADVLVIDRDGRVHQLADSGPRSRLAYEAQRRVGDGPSWMTLRSATPVLTSTAISKVRPLWPTFARVTRQLHLASIACVPLCTAPGHALGLLDVYAGRRDAFDAAGRRVRLRRGARQCTAILLRS